MVSDQLKGQFLKLKTSYDEHFRGELKFEPASLKDRFYRDLMLALKEAKSSSEKTKLKNLLYSYNTHRHKWDNMLRNIEKGLIERKSAFNSQKKVTEKSFDSDELIELQVQSLFGDSEKSRKIIATLKEKYKALASDKQGRPKIQIKDGKIKMKIQLGND